MTRMMKIVPARRVVTDASAEPPNIARSRAITPAGGAVAGCASITTPAENPSGTVWCGHRPAYQPFVKIRSPGVVPAFAGTTRGYSRLILKADPRTKPSGDNLSAAPAGSAPGGRPSSSNEKRLTPGGLFAGVLSAATSPSRGGPSVGRLISLVSGVTTS